MHASDPELQRFNAERGAENIVQRCLCVARGESVYVVSWHCPEIADMIARAVEACGATVRRLRLDPFEHMIDADRTTTLTSELSGCDASIMVAAPGLDTTLSAAVLRAAQAAGTRHAHAPSIDLRLMSQSVRADPDIIAKLNDRIRAVLRPGTPISVTSESGTNLRVTLSARFPLASGTGRPTRGSADYLPSGAVYGHAASVDGTYIADRGVVGSGVRAVQSAVRRSPVTARFAQGRLVSFECADAEASAALQRYLDSHLHAGRVGMVIIPTNYIARAEIGLDIQDRLLPGFNVSLGFSASKVTRAPFDAPVQLQLFARRIHVESGSRKIVIAGRFDEALLEGIDPFR